MPIITTRKRLGNHDNERQDRPTTEDILCRWSVEEIHTKHIDTTKNMMSSQNDNFSTIVPNESLINV